MLVFIYFQWTRLGTFHLDGEHGGRAIYRQDNNDNYLYFLVNRIVPGCTFTEFDARISNPLYVLLLVLKIGYS